MSVQDNISVKVLQQFGSPISVSLISKAGNWQNRQKIQYEAQKGLANQDFHSLKDWKEQMNMYSNTSHILKIAYTIIKQILTNNRLLSLTLTTIPGMGQVGGYIKTMGGFNQVFQAPQDILTNSSALKSRINALS